MTEIPYICFTVCAAAAALTLLLSALLQALHERRRRGGDALLRAKYLHGVMLSLASDDPQVPYFPLFGRLGTRQLLCETVAGIVTHTYSLQPEAMRRIVARYRLDSWMLRQAHRHRGFRRARALAILSALPTDERILPAIEPFLRSRRREVRFHALLVQLAADPSNALRRLGDYPWALSASEIAEVLLLLRRGMLPLAYGPLLEAEAPNLRRMGVGIVRQFGIAEAERMLLHRLADETESDLRRELLHTLCSLHRPMLRREVEAAIAALSPAERRTLLRRMAAEGYAPETLQRLFDERERPLCETLVQSYKRTLA